MKYFAQKNMSRFYPVSRMAFWAILMIVLISGCTVRDADPSGTPGMQPGESVPPGGLAYIPQAQKLKMPAISEAGYEIYGTAWIRDDLLLVMTQKGAEGSWEYRLFAYHTGSGKVTEFATDIENYGWFGRRLEDGRLCMYDYDRILLFNTEKFTCEVSVTFPQAISVGELDVSPDGKRLVYTDMESGDLYITGTNFTDTALLIGASGDAGETGLGKPSTPVWSPDGKYIYYEIYEDDMASLHVISTDGTNEKQLLRMKDCSFHLLSDGSFLLLSFHGELRRFDPATGAVELLLPGREYLPVSWDDRGNYAAAVLIGEQGENDCLQLFSLNDSKQLRQWTLPQYAPIYFDFDSFSPDGSKFSFLYTNDDGQNDCYLLRVE